MGETKIQNRIKINIVNFKLHPVFLTKIESK